MKYCWNTQELRKDESLNCTPMRGMRMGIGERGSQCEPDRLGDLRYPERQQV